MWREPDPHQTPFSIAAVTFLSRRHPRILYLNSGMFKYVVENMEFCSVTPKYGGEEPLSKPLHLPTNETNDIIPRLATMDLDSTPTMTMEYVGHRR